MSRLVFCAAIVCGLVVGMPLASAAQERAPGGQIYGELLPFVHLDGVRVQVRGLRGIIYNLPEPGEEPIRKSTGMDRKQMSDLHESIEADIAEAFRRRGVPLLGVVPPTYPDTRPLLVVELFWSTPCSRTDLFVLTTRTELQEPARPLRDPSRLVWPVSWGRVFQRGVVREALPKEIRSDALAGIGEFLTLYARAHAR